MFRSLPTENDLKFEDLFKSDTLKMHVEKVKDVVEMLINKMDNVEDLVNTLIEFGRHHHVLGAQQKYATVKKMFIFPLHFSECALSFGIPRISISEFCIESHLALSWEHHLFQKS